MAKGLRFFGTDYNENRYGGTPDASSRESFSVFAFDGIPGTKWTSSGEDSDGDDVFLEMDFGVSRSIDSFFIYNTNIKDIEVQYYDGADWVTCDSLISTVVKSGNGIHLFVKLNSQINTQKVRAVGSETIIPNEEKYITMFRSMLEIGQFEYFPDFRPKYRLIQNKFNVTDGRCVILERGEQFVAEMNFKSHINQKDIDLAETLCSLKEPFFIWANGGDESIFSYKFRPYRFEDIIKVSISDDVSPTLTKNYYKSGYNNKIYLEEMV